MIFKPSEVKVMRVRLGLTQAKLAELAGVTQAYIAKIEAGEADPRVSTLEKISKALEQVGAGEQHISVGQIMSSPIISVRPTDRIERAVRLMKSHDISQLPVLDGDVPVGSVSETTVVRKIASGENMSKLLKRSVSEIMDGPLPTVSKDSDVDVAYHLLEYEPAVVVLERGKAVGIVAKADVFKLTGKPKT
ncbi:MAG: CBS domain-containing protein [Candidatus Hodarchaeaceae archaeon]|nr:CBS domain-containing protein [Candidatus Hodarchaeaceae archaeon]